MVVFRDNCLFKLPFFLLLFSCSFFFLYLISPAACYPLFFFRVLFFSYTLCL